MFQRLTYIQSGFDPARYLEQVKALERLLAGEVMMHLEFLRTKDGANHRVRAIMPAD